ncbi:MAG: PqqD family protein [Herbinix sp.]|nr:PqqD family protein [Herbinix sp.]
MKRKEGFMLRSIGSQYIVVALGNASKDFNGVIRLNKTAKLLWEQLTNERNEGQLVSAMMEQYDVDETTAKSDVTEFIIKIRNAGLINE